MTTNQTFICRECGKPTAAHAPDCRLAPKTVRPAGQSPAHTVVQSTATQSIAQRSGPLALGQIADNAVKTVSGARPGVDSAANDNTRPTKPSGRVQTRKQYASEFDAFIRPEHLATPKTYQIAAVAEELLYNLESKQKEPTMVLHFERTTKKLRMNNSSQRALIDALGDELQGWIWEWVTLRDGKASNGKRTVVISRGSPPKSAASPAPTEAPALPHAGVDTTTGEIAVSADVPQAAAKS